MSEVAQLQQRNVQKKGVFLPRRYFTIFARRDILNSPIFNLSPIAGIQRSLVNKGIFGKKYALSENDLVLRRFSPVDYGQPLTETVICPYSGCPFSTGDETPPTGDQAPWMGALRRKTR